MKTGFWGAIAITGSSLCFGLLVSPSDGALPEVKRSQPESVLQRTTGTSSRFLSQANLSFDVDLLAKVIQQFFKSAAYQTESEIQVSSVDGNTTVQSGVKVKTIAQHPNKFRSEITFTKSGDGTQKITTLIVSNGSKVWLYRSDLNQYQALDYEQFDNLEDTFWLGFSNSIYTQIPSEVRDYILEAKPSSQEIVEAAGLEMGDIRGGKRIVDNQSLYAYEYKDAKDGFMFTAFVEPSTATLQQLQIAGKSDGMNVTISERILSRTANPAIAPDTFTFSPPTGSKQVDTLEIGPL